MTFVWRWKRSCRTEPLIWGIWCYLQGYSVISELHCRIPYWYLRNAWYCMRCLSPIPIHKQRNWVESNLFYNHVGGSKESLLYCFIGFEFIFYWYIQISVYSLINVYTCEPPHNWRYKSFHHFLQVNICLIWARFLLSYLETSYNQSSH